MSEISLTVGGRELRNWTRWEVESDLLTPADAWSLSVGQFTGEELTWLTPGQRVSLSLGGEEILRGLIDEVSLSYDAQNRGLTVTGRDMAAPLVDCTLPAWTLYDTTLAQAAAKALAYLELTDEVVAAGGATEAGTLRVEPEETAWQFLERYARQRECLIWYEPGALHIAPPDYDLDEGWVLRQGPGGNVKAARILWSVADRYSQVTVRGQAADGSRIEATREDEEISTFRPRRFTDHGATSWSLADRRARWELEDRRVRGLDLMYTVAGHRYGDALWAPRRLVQVDDPLGSITGSYFITAVRRSLDTSAGSQSILTLRRPGALLGLPEPATGVF